MKEEEELTKREKQILNLVSEGYTNQEIAEKLDISQNTVGVHRNHLLKKAGVHNTVRLVVWGIINGYLDNDKKEDT